MTLKDLMNVTGSGVYLRVATEHGNGWLFHDILINLDINSCLNDSYADREVINIYDVERREGSHRCCELQAGIAVIVEGDECGGI